MEEFHHRMEFEEAAEAEATRLAGSGATWVPVRHVWKAGKPYYLNVQDGSKSMKPPAGMPPVQPLSSVARYGRAVGKPQCPYGTNCTRRNPQHFTEQDHPLFHPMVLISDHLQDHLPAYHQLEQQPRAAAALAHSAPSAAWAASASAAAAASAHSAASAASAASSSAAAAPAAAAAPSAGKKRAAPDAENAGQQAATKRKVPTAKQQAKEDERAAREAKKAIGDGIKQGLRLPAQRGSLHFSGLRPEVVDLIFKDAIEGAGGGGHHSLTKAELVTIFGTTKIEKGGSRDERYDCERAGVTYDASARTLRLDYDPKAMGSNIWWKNR